MAQQLKQAKPELDVSRQQGIVIPAGGPVLLRNAAALVNVIRQHYHSGLPIEIFYQGPQEWHEAAGSLLKGYADVTCVDTDSKNLPAHHNADSVPGFGLKILALDREGYMATESGQILLDREKHADVLEWLCFLQSHADIFKRYMYGDKDFYPLAFALADKASLFTQVPVAPRMALHEEQESPNYLQLGMVQSDEMGVLSFLHRTTYVLSGAWVGK
ncbi:hypothetical protein WJX84_007023 [Apatococcus fuscideae]|uniref:Uncharacterized protein n=1 Tax=Apatococcus fuscideae TaxID=2026836 RepID=A0AAW1RXV5_9CHLO